MGLPPADSLHHACATALGRGDALSALSLVSGREDTLSLALRGTALAQLGEHVHARRLLEQAAAAFAEQGAVLHHARARAALAELAAARRDISAALRDLTRVQAELVELEDHENATWVSLVLARRRGNTTSTQPSCRSCCVAMPGAHLTSPRPGSSTGCDAAGAPPTEAMSI